MVAKVATGFCIPEEKPIEFFFRRWNCIEKLDSGNENKLCNLRTIYVNPC